MPQSYQYIELSFINDFNEIKRQAVDTVAITFLLSKKYKAVSLNAYLENTQYGYTASATDSGTHQLLRITDINSGIVNWKNVPYCNCEEGEKYLLKENDILVARTGGTTGKSFLIKKVSSNAVFASYLIRLRANKKCLPEFISIFLNSYVFWSQISELKSGSAQPNVNAEKLKTLSIPECPVNIQQKVVDIISGVDVEGGSFSIKLKEKIQNVLSVLDNNEKLRQELNQQQTYLQLLRQTILQEAVQGGLSRQDPTDEPATELLKRIKAEKEKLIKGDRLKKEKELPPITEEEIPFSLPEGWVWCRLGNVVLKSEAGKSLVCDKRSAEANEWGIIKVSAMSWGKFNEQENKALPKGIKPFVEYKVNEGDYLISRANTDELIGKSVIVGKLNLNLLLSDKSIRICFSDFVDKFYINFYNNSSIAREYYKRVATGTSNSMKNISREQMYMLPIPLPPLAEQQRIVAKVQGLQQQLSLLEAQVAQSRQYAQQLLQTVLKEAFENKGKVYEINEELSLAAED